MKRNFFQNLFGKPKHDTPKIWDLETEAENATNDKKVPLERAKNKFERGIYQSALVDM